MLATCTHLKQLENAAETQFLGPETSQMQGGLSVDVLDVDVDLPIERTDDLRFTGSLTRSALSTLARMSGVDACSP